MHDFVNCISSVFSVFVTDGKTRVLVESLKINP